MARTAKRYKKNTEKKVLGIPVCMAAIYVRLSVDSDEKKSESIETQVTLIKEFIQKHNENPNREYEIAVYDIYSDLGKTGTNFDRPGFERMMNDVRAGKINCILVKDFSRFGRNYIETGNYLEKILPFMKVRFVSVCDNYDSYALGAKNQELSMNIKNLVNDAYAKDISAKEDQIENTKAELEEAKAVEKEQYASMKLRIQYMYENSSGNGYMAMLFSSKSISELISRAEYIQKISDFDRDLMQEYEDTVDQVKEKETQVQEEQAAIVELQQQSSDQQEAIQELYAAAYQELRTYSAELDDAKSSESALVDEINSKADAINDLIRQAKEEEIAAQKKAEEEAAAAAAAQQAAAEAEAEAARKQAAEAARVAAAEAANAAAKADTDTSSSSGSSSSDSSASSTTTGSPSASDTSSSSSSGTYLGRFKLTGYCSCSICTGQWSGGSTASGTTPTAGRTIAMGGANYQQTVDISVFSEIL